ncbi:hypothetical protein P3T36_003719 [Kitasatospora sp. MAP12-15]|uniref:MvdC/MvdD family ATP grasp protein n=1 Tax=unclassified Kitasatospora TaxID=2633591 RepID=UPI0024731032|nr:hypothetical protein [Kitasatospora sp. MAP12-44]MDH6112307.1 hypothetical protein [Kitasatospora sp. MAP12-44]
MDHQRGSVLVLTNPLDVTADAVLRVLAERRVPVVRLDPGTDLHTGASLTATYRTGDQRGALRTASRELDLMAVRSVWVRRASPYDGPPDLDGHARRFAASQSLWGVGGILASLPGAHYTPVAVPESVARAVSAYLCHFRLTFGAFDFAVTAAGAWYFLECNPNGQWAWQPSEITDRIAHAIADQLQKGPAA